MAPPKLMLALYQPDIPQNTGNLLRTSACFGAEAAIILPAGFDASDRGFRRSGMDYLKHVDIARHDTFEAFLAWARGAARRIVLLTGKTEHSYLDCGFRPGDILLIGRESAGAPEHVHLAADARVRIPIRPETRSLNAAVAGAVVLAEAMRQTGGFPAAAAHLPQPGG